GGRRAERGQRPLRVGVGERVVCAGGLGGETGEGGTGKGSGPARVRLRFPFPPSPFPGIIPRLIGPDPLKRPETRPRSPARWRRRRPRRAATDPPAAPAGAPRR